MAGIPLITLVANEGCCAVTVWLRLMPLPDWSFQAEMGVLLILLEVPLSAFNQKTLLADDPTPAGPLWAGEKMRQDKIARNNKKRNIATKVQNSIKFSLRPCVAAAICKKENLIFILYFWHLNIKSFNYVRPAKTAITKHLI